MSSHPSVGFDSGNNIHFPFRWLASLSCALRGEALLLQSLKFEHLEKAKKVECFITSIVESEHFWHS